jgi:hypothetical protein
VKSHPTKVACNFKSDVDLPLAPQEAEASLVIVESQYVLAQTIVPE